MYLKYKTYHFVNLCYIFNNKYTMIKGVCCGNA